MDCRNGPNARRTVRNPGNTGAETQHWAAGEGEGQGRARLGTGDSRASPCLGGGGTCRGCVMEMPTGSGGAEHQLPKMRTRMGNGAWENWQRRASFDALCASALPGLCRAKVAQGAAHQRNRTAGSNPGAGSPRSQSLEIGRRQRGSGAGKQGCSLAGLGMQAPPRSGGGAGEGAGMSAMSAQHAETVAHSAGGKTLPRGSKEHATQGSGADQCGAGHRSQAPQAAAHAT